MRQMTHQCGEYTNSLLCSMTADMAVVPLLDVQLAAPHCVAVLFYSCSRGCAVFPVVAQLAAPHCVAVLFYSCSRGCALRAAPGLISIAPSGRLVFNPSGRLVFNKILVGRASNAHIWGRPLGLHLCSESARNCFFQKAEACGVFCRI